MKKLFFLIVPALLLAIGVFFLVHYIAGLGEQKGALQVTSSPDSKVYLDDHYLGQTPLCKCDSGDMITPGDYTIKLVPLDSSLTAFEDKVTITSGVLTVVDRKFGKDSLSEGSIISLTPLPDKTDSQLLVVSFPEGANVFLDDNPIGSAPLVYKHPTESDHVVRVSKSGYNDKTVRIRTPLGYKLTIAIYLSTIPAGTTPEQNSPKPSVAPSSAGDLFTTPSPTPSTKVVILNTPTGFLRVHQSASITSNEIAEVHPGETFPLLSEQDGWLEIQLSDGTKGWVSAQYTRKQ